MTNTTYRRNLKETHRASLLFRLAQGRERLALRIKGRPDLRSTIVVAGSGRGGTSWLAELLATAPGMQIIFEPLHPGRVPAPGGLNALDGSRELLESPYLRPDGASSYENERWERFFQRALAGEVRNWWTDQERRHLFTWRYAVKLIRANLMLAWLHECFGCPIILIVRHPCAVVRSRLVRGWSAPVEWLLNQPVLMEDYLHPHAALIRAARDDLERHAVLWAVETLVALRQMDGREGMLVFYETLCAQPVEQMRRLCARFGLPFSTRMERQMQKQSLVKDGRGVVVPKEYMIGRWQRDMSTTDRDKILGIARAFGLSLYDETPHPTIQHPTSNI